MKPTCNDAQTVLEHVEDIKSVIPYVLVAERLSGESEGGAYEMSGPEMLVRHEDDEIEIRMRMILNSSVAKLVSDIGIIYALREPIEASAEAMREFIERVAGMALFPYMREAMHSSAARLGVDPPVLGIVRAGELKLDAHDEQDEDNQAPK